MSKTEALAQYQKEVGQEAAVGEWLTVTQAMIDGFAAATGDRQWIHVDPDRARHESPFGATVAHGFLTLSLIPYLTGSPARREPEPGPSRLAVNYGLNRVRFPHPVVAGSRVRARSRLVSVEESADGSLQRVVQVTVEVEGAPKPACVAEMITRLYF